MDCLKDESQDLARVEDTVTAFLRCLKMRHLTLKDPTEEGEQKIEAIANSCCRLRLDEGWPICECPRN